MNRITTSLLALATSLVGVSSPASADKPVKVHILAGRSNMAGETMGKGMLELLTGK